MSERYRLKTKEVTVTRRMANRVEVEDADGDLLSIDRGVFECDYEPAPEREFPEGEYIRRTDAFIAEKIICPWHEQDKGEPGEPCGKCLTCVEESLKLADELAKVGQAMADAFHVTWMNSARKPTMAVLKWEEALDAYLESRKGQ